MTKYYNLGLDPTAVPDWGIQEGLREFIQNWRDNKEESTYKYQDGRLTLRNNDTVLPSSVLLTGYSGKRDDDSTVGRHGDGFGSSLAVFMREGRSVTITNGDYLWMPELRHCDVFNVELVQVRETLFGQGTYYEVSIEITDEEWSDVKSRYLPFQDDIGEVFESTQGTVLLDERFKGKVFCGGIYVTTDKNLSYGYDFLPSALTLDRDRQTVRLFDMQWVTRGIMSEMSYDEDKVDLVVESITSNKADTQYIDYNSPSEVLVEKCHDAFVEKFGEDSIVAESAEECQQLKKSGYKNVVFTGNSVMAQMVKKSSKYKTLNQHVAVKMPQDYMREWLEKYEGEMTTGMYHSFEDLIENVIDAC